MGEHLAINANVRSNKLEDLKAEALWSFLILYRLIRSNYFCFMEHGSDITDNFSYGEFTFLMLLRHTYESIYILLQFFYGRLMEVVGMVRWTEFLQHHPIMSSLKCFLD